VDIRRGCFWPQSGPHMRGDSLGADIADISLL
jgi:hypothetical protein